MLPSHGLPFRGLHERIDQLIGHHQERLERTLEACAMPLTLAEVMPRLFDRALDVHQLQFALGESLAHLNYLVEQGLLERQTGETAACATAHVPPAKRRSLSARVFATVRPGRPGTTAIWQAASPVLIVQEAAGAAQRRAHGRAGSRRAGESADDRAARGADPSAARGPHRGIGVGALARAERQRGNQGQRQRQLAHQSSPVSLQFGMPAVARPGAHC